MFARPGDDGARSATTPSDVVYFETLSVLEVGVHRITPKHSNFAHIDFTAERIVVAW